MTTSQPGWLGRHRRQLGGWVVPLLLLVIAIESLLLYVQMRAAREIEAQSSKLLAKFLEDEEAPPAGAPGVSMRLQNVRFKWSDKVYIDADRMAVRAVPIQGRVVDFDDLSSFVLNVQKSDVDIRPEVLEGMFNESVFNYPDSNVRGLGVSIKEKDGERLLRISGSLKLVLWIPFELRARLSVDAATNTLVIDVEKVDILEFLPATGLIKWKPLRLEQLIALPPNETLLVHGNRIMVKPFGLFPPPRINGRISNVTVGPAMIRLGFAGEAIEAPEAGAKNYIAIRGGASQFGSFRMLRTDLLILDGDESDAFVFSLEHYSDLVPKSRIELENTRSARVTMPDA